MIKEILLNFQYQYSKLFVLGIKRKKFVLISTEEELFAMNTSKNTFFALLFTLFASGHLFSGLIEGVASEKKLGAGFYFIFSFLFIVGVIAFRQFLWLVNGRQEMTIENGKLTLFKKGTFFTKPKTYSLDKIRNIRPVVSEHNLSLIEKIHKNMIMFRKVIFNHVQGQVLFDYEGETIKVFSDLNEVERTFLIGEMNKRFKNN